MKMPILIAILLIISGTTFAETLKFNPENWSNPWSFLWTFKEDSMVNLGKVGKQFYKSAPHSRTYEVEAVMEPKERLDDDWIATSLLLYQDAHNFWQFGLADVPLKQREEKNHKPYIEMLECSKGRWVYKDNYTIVENTGEFAWEFNTPYRLKLKLEGDLLRGTVHDLNGKQLFARTLKLKPGLGTRLVTPGISAGPLKTVFSQIQIKHGEPEALPEPPNAQFKPYHSKSFVDDIRQEPTGFFHVKKLEDGRWWAIDPLGRGFVPFGVDHCGYWGMWCEALNYSPYKVNNDKKYANQEEWAVETLERLQDWGFNMLTGSTSPLLRHRGLAHTITLNLGEAMAAFGNEFAIHPANLTPGTAFPNVFHPNFMEFCEYKLAKTCQDNANNPWLFGYFTDNELRWTGYGTPKTGLFNAVAKLPPEHSAKIALAKFLKEKAQNDLKAFNDFWNADIDNLDKIVSLDALPETSSQQIDVKQEFLGLAAKLYFSTIRQVVKKYDPNHMMLGARFAGIHNHDSIIWEMAGQFSELVSFNQYGEVDLHFGIALTGSLPLGKPLEERFREAHEWANCPLFITEWSFPALDSKLPCTCGAGQRFYTQAERAQATGIYARTLLAMPFMVGYDYFMWVDQPELGISKKFPENSNYGLVDKDNKPYKLLVDTLKAIQRNPGQARRDPAPKPYKEVIVEDRGNLYRSHLQPLPNVGDGPTDPAFKFTCDKTAFTATNGNLVLTALQNQARITIERNGAPFGTFNVMLSYYDAKRSRCWTDAAQLVNAEIKAGSERMAINLSVIKPVHTQEAKQDAISTRQFQVDYRIVLLPNQDWFLAEITKITNLDSKDGLPLASIFFRLNPQFPVHPLGERKIWRLWNEEERCIWREKDGNRYLGITSKDYLNIVLNFWTDNNDGIYSDVFRSMTDILKPKESQTPKQPLYVIAYFGNGSKQDALKQAEKLKALDSSSVAKNSRVD